MLEKSMKMFSRLAKLSSLYKAKCLVTRLCHRSTLCPIPDLEKMTLVKTINKNIDKNNNLHLDSPIHVKIMPVDLENIEKHETITMQIYSHGKDTTDFQVKQSSKRLELVNTKCTELSDVCVIRIPFNLNVSITTTEDASVEIEKLLLENFSVSSVNGSVVTKDLQAKDVKINSVSGSILCKGRLQAENIELKSGETSGISCNNVLANNFQVSTHSGPICISSCYSENSHFQTALGDINLDHLHKTTKIDIIQQGNLHVAGLRGNIQASIKSGDVFMHVSKLIANSSIFIHEKGKVDLRMSDILEDVTVINLIAEKIDVDDMIKDRGNLMSDSHPQRFRFPKNKENTNSELVVECRNGVIELRKADVPFYMPKCPDIT